MFRRTLVTLTIAAAVLGLSASSALALDCANVSRPVPAQPTAPVLSDPGNFTVWVVQGDWWFVTFGPGGFSQGFWDKVPPGTVAFLGFTAEQLAALGFPAGTVNGSYQGGQGFGLLDNAQAPCNASRQTSHGIQAESERC